MEKLNLRELKGAPLSIILAIVMAGNRSVSVSWLVTETGYSDKTVNSGLDLLRSRQIITQTGRCRYQLTGENVQLPLYWGEKVEPANPSPASIQPALFELSGEAENFSGKIPESGNIPILEKRVSELEKRVSELEKRKNSGVDTGNTPENGNFQGESGEIPNLLLTTTRNNNDTDINQVVLLDRESGEIPEDKSEKFRNPDDCKKMIAELQDYYRQRDHCGFRLFPDYLVIGDETIEKISALLPDARVLEYIIPRAENTDALIEWCELSFRDAKRKLLKDIGIFGKYAARIMADDNIPLCVIDYHYWKWMEEKNEHPEYKISLVGYRISEGFDNLAARTSDPLKFNWIK